jgi:hypothetical protein
MEAEPRSIQLPRGQAWEETWNHLDADDAAINLTGMTGELEISASAAGGVLATGTWTPGATAGQALLELTEEQVATLAAHRVGHWKLVVTDTLGVPHEARGTIYMLD